MLVSRVLAIGAVALITACSTLEAGVDRVRDVVVAHPIVTAVAVGAVAGSIAIAADRRHNAQALLVRRPVEHTAPVRP